MSAVEGVKKAENKELGVMTKTLIIGERECLSLGNSLTSQIHLTMPLDEWAVVSVKLGAFNDSLSRHKLRSIGIDVDVESASSMNLLPPAPSSGDWDAAKARLVAAETWHTVLSCDRVFLVGRRVAIAHNMLFGRQVRPAKWPMLHSTTIGETHVMLVPHPSGLNHFWNDPIEVDVARELVEEFLASS